MLELYIKSDNKNIQMFNDDFFDLHINKVKLNNQHAKIIKTIDFSDLDIENRRIIPRYNKKIYVPLTELSTGCKTVLNILNFPNICFYVNECGKNALTEILKLREGKIYMREFCTADNFQNDIKVIYNNQSTIVHNSIELNDLLYKIF